MFYKFNALIIIPECGDLYERKQWFDFKEKISCCSFVFRQKIIQFIHTIRGPTMMPCRHGHPHFYHSPKFARRERR
ncbi:Uncharacterised protein [Shigella sonnei]|nr:Uncharacterised protein [Shigella sonnei]